MPTDGGWIAGARFTAADVYVGSAVDWGIKFGTLPERPGFMLYCYEMGRYERKPNRVVPELDLIYGAFVIVKLGEDGESANMNDREAWDLMHYFAKED
jgi:hypothetical protein